MINPSRPLIPLQSGGVHLYKLSLPPMQNLPIYIGKKVMNGVFTSMYLALMQVIFSLKLLKEPLYHAQPVPMGPNPVLVPHPVPPRGLDQDTTHAPSLKGTALPSVFALQPPATILPA